MGTGFSYKSEPENLGRRRARCMQQRFNHCVHKSSGGCSADADFAGGADAGLRAETVPSRHRDGRLRQLAADARASYKRAPVTMRRATVEQRLELDKDNSARAHAATMNAMRKMECQFGRAAASAAGESWKHADKL